MAHLTDKGVLVELLQVRGGLWRSVDDLAIIDIGLSEVFDRCVRSVSMLDGTWGHVAQEGVHVGLEERTSQRLKKARIRAKPSFFEGGTKLR